MTCEMAAIEERVTTLEKQLQSQANVLRAAGAVSNSTRELIDTLHKQVDKMFEITSALGTPLLNGEGRVRTLRSPDGSIDIRLAEDCHAVDLELPDGRFEALEMRISHINSVLEALTEYATEVPGRPILLPGVHRTVESDEDRRDYRMGLWAIACVLLGGVTAGIIAAAIWWMQ